MVIRCYEVPTPNRTRAAYSPEALGKQGTASGPESDRSLHQRFDRVPKPKAWRLEVANTRRKWPWGFPGRLKTWYVCGQDNGMHCGERTLSPSSSGKEVNVRCLIVMWWAKSLSFMNYDETEQSDICFKTGPKAMLHAVGRLHPAKLRLIADQSGRERHNASQC